MIRSRPCKPSPQQQTLCLFVKRPVAGGVKTRLARDTGVGEALRFYRQSTKKLAATLARDARWRVVLCVAPNDACHAPAACWPPHLPRLAQGPGNLGAKMGRAVRRHQAGSLAGGRRGGGRLVIIGSDAPQVTPHHIARAFDALRRQDFVFGPSPDGGYWLIGYRGGRRPPASLFANVRWSSAHALDDTLASIPANYGVGFINSLTDVDEAADLWGARAHLSISHLPW